MTDISNNSILPSNSSLDKITLELLINKKQYSKYLSKSDPSKYEEHKTFFRDYWLFNVAKLLSFRVFRHNRDSL